MSTKEEEAFLKSGFQTILQAFEIQTINYNKEKEKYESFISSLQSENEILKDENEKLKSDNVIISQENNQLKTKIDSLSSELHSKQDKIQMIKHSIQDDQHQYEYHVNYRPPIQNKKIYSNLFNNYANNMTNEQNSSSFIYNPSSVNNSVLSKKANDVSYKSDKFNSIQQRIDSIKSNNSVPKKQVRKLEVFDMNNHTNINTQNSNLYRLDNNTDRPSGNKSKQYELSNKFLNECRLALNPSLFNQMTILFHDYREGRKNDKDVSVEVKRILHDNTRLIHLFDIIFQSD